MNTAKEIKKFLLHFFESRGALLSTDPEKFDIIKSNPLDSFELMTLLIEVEIHFGVKVDPESLIMNSTIEELSKHIKNSL